MLDSLLAPRCMVKNLMAQLGAWIGGACAVLVICAFLTPALAQSASFRTVDTNSDRVLSRDELISAFGVRGAEQLLAQSDRNGDGKLTIFELRQGSRSRGDTGDTGRNDRDDGDENADDDGDRDDNSSDRDGGGDGDGDGGGDGDGDGDGDDD